MTLLRFLRSFTSGNKPAKGKLPEGSLAFNIADKKLWVGNQVDDPILLASLSAEDIQLSRISSDFNIGSTVQQAIEQIAFDVGSKSGVSLIDDISPQFNSSKTNFPISIGGSPYKPPSSYSLMVHLDGAYQYPGKSYVVSESQLNFYEPPETNQKAYIVALGDPSLLLGEIPVGLAPGSITPTSLDRAYVDKSGDVLSGALGVPASLETSPGIFIAQSPTTGVYGDQNNMGFSIGGEKQLSVNASGVLINNSLGIPVGTTSQRPPGVNGLTRIDSDTEQLEFYLNGSWKALQSGLSATNTIQNLENLTPEFDGVSTTFTLNSGGSTVSPVDSSKLLIFLSGEAQTPEQDFTVSATEITFSSPPITGTEFSGLYLVGTYTIGTVSDRSITSSKLVSGISVELSDGTQGAPSLRFSQESSTGFYRSPAQSSVSLAISGTPSVEFSVKSLRIPQSSSASRKPTPKTGDLSFNTTKNSLEIWGGSWEEVLTDSVNVNTLNVEPLPIPNADLPSGSVKVEDIIKDIYSKLSFCSVVVDMTTATPTILRAKNVSNVVRISQGVMRIEFATSFLNTNFFATYSAQANSFQRITVGEDFASRTVGSVLVTCAPANSSSAPPEDYPYVTAEFRV